MLQKDWVERILTRMLARYGTAWIRAWEGIDPEAIKADWADVLSGMPAVRIAYGLENLPPDRPPNSAQFRNICMQMPSPTFKALPPLKADPEKAAAAVKKLRELADQMRMR